ncbi:TRAP transporter small permease subunit [Sulfurospirillum sp. T05]|uniref:TRAP transporter small permease subunit n=1 Tax=Sulfurospirillum tamanense TaxID=2813362 RepID=A0ABS2WPQ8_9BACT|nr:TRAP transporter small permease subunit [Sulfurospirillum tamanensis]MBN2963622.1 TRAP transporter small permease subunit [Sulfurospirillum tamanensis]
MLERMERFFDTLANWIGHACGILMSIMMLNVFYNVVMRYFFKTGSIGMQELEWHFFSLIILFGISYALKEDAHVRVDVIYDRLQPKRKALINIFGAIVFIVPISVLIATGSTEFVLEAYRSNEGSGDPGGLPFRWIIKGMIPLSFYLLLFINLGFIIKNINLYRAHSCPTKEA